MALGVATVDASDPQNITWSLSNVAITETKATFTVKTEDAAGNKNDGTGSLEIQLIDPAQVTNITVEDDLTDIVDGTELDDSTDPQGSATSIDGVEGNYEGIVSQAEGDAPLDGLTNDNTPIVTVTLDKDLVSEYQDINIVRSYQRADGQWVEEGTVASTAEGTLVVDSADSKVYKFEDTLVDEENDKSYRYEAKIINDPIITESPLVTSKVTEFKLDTVAQTPVITSYDDGVIIGTSAETGTVYIDYNGTRKSSEVDSEGNWTITLDPEQATTFAENNDVDNYSARNNANDQPNSTEIETIRAEEAKYDKPLSIGFVDTAGNVPSLEGSEFYYFDNNDGPLGEFNPEDRPSTATNAFENTVDGITTSTNDDGDEITTYKTTFSDAAQIIFVDGDINGYDGDNDQFLVELGGGDDVLNVDGLIQKGVTVDMGEGNDNVVTRNLQGISQDVMTTIDLGNGNNTFTRTGSGNFRYVEIIGGDGVDIYRSPEANSDVRDAKLLLGEGNNEIYSGDDFDHVEVKTGDGDDYLELDSKVNENNVDLSSVDIDLGNGNNTINVFRGGVNQFGGGPSVIVTGDGEDTIYMSNSVTEASTISTGGNSDTVTIGGFINGTSTINLDAGDDTLTIGQYISGTSTVSLGSGNDTVTIGQYISGTSTLNLDAGDDTVTIDEYIGGNSTVNLGAGDDTINLGYFNDGSGSLVDGGDGIDVLNLTGNNTGGSNDIAINNVEVVQLEGTNASYDLDWSDIMMSDGSNDDISEVYINQTGSENTIDLDNGWTKDTTATPPATDPLGGAHSYDVYVQTQNGITETLYIEQGINVVI